MTGDVDALHTLALSFSSGDTSLLTPELSPVPEPSTALLVLGGLAMCGRLRASDRRGRALRAAGSPQG